jgi:3,4-dihydroxy 2-butanone 4-phosphate synthase/GTP cyclohydrolase II
MPVFESWLSQAEQHCQKYRRPLVSLCYAQSLDGCLAAQPGQPTALSGEDAMRLTHRLRAAHDAILVGVGTVLADNPHLTVRMVAGASPQPVILDSHLRTPPGANLALRHIGPGGLPPAWIATTRQADPQRKASLEAAGVRILTLPSGEDGRVALPALLERLARRGIRSLMVEGGAQVITRFLELELADWTAITIAPVLMGGLHTVQSALPDLCRPSEVQYERAGQDLVIFGRLR